MLNYKVVFTQVKMIIEIYSWKIVGWKKWKFSKQKLNLFNTF